MASRSIVHIAFSLLISTCFLGNLFGAYFLWELSGTDMFQLLCYGFAVAALAVTGAGLFLSRALGFRFVPVRARSNADVVAEQKQP